MKNKTLVIAACIVLIIAVGFGAGFGYGYVKNDIDGNRKTKTEYMLNIEPSDFQYEIGAKLKLGGIIKSDTVWCYWMDKNYPDFTYLNGEYNLNSSMSYEDIALKLQDPDISHKTVTVVIPEGYNVFDIAKALENNNVCKAEDFLAACEKKDAYVEDYSFLADIPDNDKIAYELEGFLFPATYDLGENTEPAEVVSEMLYAFSNRMDDSWTDFCKTNNMSLYELITLSSVVEKETLGNGVASKIADVFLNRLEIGQQLQSDVTINYGNLLRTNGFDDATVTSYNTYKCAALPSGPVCNPGVANIEAVINHDDTEYFYFFSDLNKEFHFAKTYEEFEELKAKYPWE